MGDVYTAPQECSLLKGLFEEQGAAVSGAGCVRLGTRNWFLPLTGRTSLAKSLGLDFRPDCEDKCYCGGTRQALLCGDAEAEQITTGW